jgi:hypothetical protein
MYNAVEVVPVILDRVRKLVAMGRTWAQYQENRGRTARRYLGQTRSCKRIHTHIYTNIVTVSRSRLHHFISLALFL